MLLSEVNAIKSHIQGKRLSEILSFDSSVKNLNKGKIGQLFETQIFGKKLDNLSEADLDIYVDEYNDELIDHLYKNIKVELKVSAAKQLKNGEYRAKERLKLSAINYQHDYPDDFKDSHVYKKIKFMYLIYYLFDKDISYRDYIVLTSFINNIDTMDISILEQDYKTIVEKIRSGKAHLLSGSDTFFLEACTSGQTSQDLAKQSNSSELAKRRSFALKNSYMSVLLNDNLDEVDEIAHNEANDLIHIENTLNSLIGKTYTELKQTYAPNISHSKNEKAIVFRNILGVKTNNLNDLSLFRKANVQFKTFNVSNTCLPADGVNFFMVNWNDFDTQEWEDSKLYDVLNTKYFYCYFHKDKSTVILTFAGYKFHGFSEEDIEAARRDWEKVKAVYLSRANITDNLKSFTSQKNELFYIRTKGKTTKDSIRTYSNGEEIKGVAWWINSSWLRSNVVKPSVMLDLLKKM
ncbi:MAG: MutH/Sau3AI family endonuclease [Coprobacillaceae bacterium]